MLPLHGMPATSPPSWKTFKSLGRANEEAKTMRKDALEQCDPQLRTFLTDGKRRLEELVESARGLSEQFSWKREFEALEKFTPALKGKHALFNQQQQAEQGTSQLIAMHNDI